LHDQASAARTGKPTEGRQRAQLPSNRVLIAVNLRCPTRHTLLAFGHVPSGNAASAADPSHPDRATGSGFYGDRLLPCTKMLGRRANSSYLTGNTLAEITLLILFRTK